MELETFLDWKDKEPVAGSIISTPRRTNIIINGVAPETGGGTGPSTPRPAPTPTVSGGKGSYDGDGSFTGG